MNYIDEFLTYLDNEKNYSELTIINYRKDLMEFLDYINGSVTSANRDKIRFYLKVLF